MHRLALPASIVATSPRNLFELLLRDLSSLLITSRVISRFVVELRPVCDFSRELTATLALLATISDAGVARLHPPLGDAGVPWLVSADVITNAMITGFLTRLPLIEPGLLAAEVAVTLRLLIQHVEFEIRLSAEAALLVGQKILAHALLVWAAEWRAAGQLLRAVTRQARVWAYVADLDDTPVAQGL